MTIYSLDLRERVVAFIEKGGKKLEASRRFEVCRSTIDKWLLLKQETGTLQPLPLAPRSWRKLDPIALQTYVEKYPDERLEDYAKHFQTSPTGVWRALKRLKITRKKRRPFIENGMKANDRHF